MAKIPVPAGTPEMGPAILASGYLAKRTRAIGRWKKRWWQLTDDGTLLYFKSEERTKALGEIDVARTCYDVRLGAEQCKVEFPRGVPSCCCFSFSVLKRTYYLYAATAADAKRWAESIVNVSLVMNYRKKGSLRPLPPRPDSAASVRCRVYRRDDDRRYSNRDVSVTTLASEASDQPTELPRIVKRSRQNTYGGRPGSRSSSDSRYGSVPNLHRPRGRYIPQSASARLWLDGSPPPNGRGGRKRNPEREPHARPSSAMATHQMNSSIGSIDKLHVTRATEKGNRARQRQLPARNWWQQVDSDGYELPPRAQSVDISMLSKKRARFNTQSQQKRLLILPSHSRESSKTLSPPPVKPKPILKKMRPVLTLDDDIISEETESVDTDCPTDHTPMPPAIPPKRCSLKVSVDSKSGQRDVYLPLPPNFKPPPPPELHSGSSSPKTVTPSDSMITEVPSYSSLQTSPPNRPTPENSYNHLQQVHQYTHNPFSLCLSTDYSTLIACIIMLCCYTYS